MENNLPQMSGVRSEFLKMCIEPINPQIVRKCREISELASIPLGYRILTKMVYFRVWCSDQHSDPTIILPLESSPPPGEGGNFKII